ncbi:MAG: hypothetical protein M9938_05455 [Solirubrobacterales bacterium]|nr:hypothetical protein [Solirubrobacterales bacterium]
MNAVTVSCTLATETTVLETEDFTLIELDRLSSDGIETEMVWAVDHNMLPGIHSFEDEGVQWSALQDPLLESRAFVIGSPR